ncbi:phosphate acyltransferase PlsX [Candidatus Neoehrlichia procyonis]|uniref:Phosphate acyltransferase n=1 Tax=Candidatus Neoehrlichia procyonis str. RAC413 TaxID=1359163 RepID=A0A0F3NMM1_9RICK|nr:phosphate acyltransferase PlsX [Candidatus Neoehrlichia lotoris]KJV69026.1 fatty acid/phospholipid synthesis protein PlsX [Candidatus Neoehrlichia lotoris str. RAC413]
MINIPIALDAMGGDFAPESIIQGADFALSSLMYSYNYKVHFSIYGQEDKVMPILSKYKKLEESSTFIHVEDVVLASDKPSFAIRHRKQSSMTCAIEDVKKGIVSGAISSGNTGALMAISRFILGTLPNIDRPAIATTMPSMGKDFVLLDLGANVECNADSLFQFAIMGNAFAKTVLNRKNPKVALLNVGHEETKGTDTIREAFSLLKKIESGINFCGYVEANDILKGDVDVVVVDGFSGNVMLKMMESLAENIFALLKESINYSLATKFAGLLLKFQLKEKFYRFNPKFHNGAMLLGLNGVIVKSHGNADSIAFANAIKVAANAIYNNINVKIAGELNVIE